MLKPAYKTGDSSKVLSRCLRLFFGSREASAVKRRLRTLREGFPLKQA